MAVTNLTNTTWVIKDGDLAVPSWTSVSINFKVSTTNDVYKEIRYANSSLRGVHTDSSVTVFYRYSSRNWVDTRNKIITFIDGTGVTDTNFISWLESNAINVQILPEVNQLQINSNGEINDLNDIRIAIDTKSPTDELFMQHTDKLAEDGDMFIQKVRPSLNGWQCKIKDGKYAELWKYFEVSTSGYTGWGIFYAKDRVIDSSELEFPFEFKSVPYVSITAAGSPIILYSNADTNITTTTRAANTGVASSTSSPAYVLICYHVFGEIK